MGKLGISATVLLILTPSVCPTLAVLRLPFVGPYYIGDLMCPPIGGVPWIGSLFIIVIGFGIAPALGG